MPRRLIEKRAPAKVEPIRQTAVPDADAGNASMLSKSKNTVASIGNAPQELASGDAPSFDDFFPDAITRKVRHDDDA